MQNGQNLPRHFDVILGHVGRFETDQKALTPAPAGTAAPTGPATALASPGTSQTELIRVFYAVLYPDFTHTGQNLANCRDVDTPLHRPDRSPPMAPTERRRLTRRGRKEGPRQQHHPQPRWRTWTYSCAPGKASRARRARVLCVARDPSFRRRPAHRRPSSISHGMSQHAATAKCPYIIATKYDTAAFM